MESMWMDEGMTIGKTPRDGVIIFREGIDGIVIQGFRIDLKDNSAGAYIPACVIEDYEILAMQEFVKEDDVRNYDE